MKKKITWISNVRIIATLSILLCHTVAYFHFIPGHNVLPQFFNVGVPVFFIISGYLYGLKFKDDNKTLNLRNFATTRYFAVILPLQIFALFCVFLSWPDEIRPLLGCLFNIQGLHFLVNFSNPFYGGVYLSQSWFVTVIMLCYALLPSILTYKRRIGLSTKTILALWIVSFALAFLGMHLGYLCLFVSGFYLASDYTDLQLKPYKTIMLFVSAILLRVVCRYWFDDTVFYNDIVSSISNSTIAFSIIYITKYFDTIDLSKLRLFSFIDKYSYYIYIVHYCLLPFTYQRYGIFVSTVIFYLGTAVLAVSLKWCHDRVCLFLMSKISKA